jgi:tetraacyldisaccharide 4'-kinase
VFEVFTTWHYRRKLPTHWKWASTPLVWGYAFGVWLRKKAYRYGLTPSGKLSVPVISVGNLTTGGTGKTPVVLALAQQCVAQGKPPVILSRGYGAREASDYALATSPSLGEEPFWLQARCPQAKVIVGKRRFANAKRALTDYQPDVLLLDDGFQQLAFQEARHLLLIDRRRWFGNGELLPVGPLREPLKAIERATVIGLTYAPSDPEKQWELVERFRTLMQSQGITLKVPVVCIPFAWKQPLPLRLETPSLELGASVLGLCGIAQPRQFKKTLEQLGYLVFQSLNYHDHYDYGPEDMRQIHRTWQKLGMPSVVTTEKDQVKLESLWPEEMVPFVYTLPMEAEVPQRVLSLLMQGIS